MPHIRLEYTDNINITTNFDDLFKNLHRVLVEYGDIDINNCKSRAIKLDRYLIADDQTNSSFIHLDVRIFSGRSKEVIRNIGEHFKSVLVENFVKDKARDNVQITIEVQEIKKENYFKYP
jgi:5-carboxymethyl-2-hydroxymuconate isomerase